MSLTVSSNHEDPSVGQHAAVCVQLIDVGVQPSEKYNPSAKLIIGWEITDEPKRDGTPFIVYKWIGASLGKSAKLTEFLTAWRGKPFTNDELKAFNLTKLLGQQCTLNLIQNEKGKTEVSNCFASKPIPGQQPAPPTTAVSFFDFDTATLEDFEQLPEWAKNHVEKALDFPTLLARMLGIDFKTAQWPQFALIHETYQGILARHPEYAGFYKRVKNPTPTQGPAKQEPLYPDDEPTAF